MHNNHVTYDDKWKTPENEAALKKLEAKYFDRSECSPHCPLSWAVEVLELFERLDKDLGIKYNESTIRGYRIKGDWIKWFITGPWVDMWQVVKNTYNPPNYWNKALSSRIKNFPKKIFTAFTGSFIYGFKAIWPKYINPHLNKFLKKRIALGQVKEKYGSLTIYTQSEEAFSEYVDQEKRRCEIKLAMKGAYYPLENFYNASTRYHVGNKYRPDTLRVRGVNEDGSIDVSFTLYRKVMKDLGLDLEEVAKRAPSKEEE